MVKGVARQGIASRKGIALKPVASRYGLTNEQRPYIYAGGTWTFTAPKAGYWKFALHGPGGNGDPNGTGGGSGAYCEKTKYLAAGQNVALVVGTPTVVATVGTATSATFPDGSVASAGPGLASTSAGGAAGTPAGGDVMYSGTAGMNTGANNGGAGLGPGGAAGNNYGGGAPGTLEFPGGRGGRIDTDPWLRTGETPGAGGGFASSIGFSGGNGRAVVVFVRD